MTINRFNHNRFTCTALVKLIHALCISYINLQVISVAELLATQIRVECGSGNPDHSGHLGDFFCESQGLWVKKSSVWLEILTRN